MKINRLVFEFTRGTIGIVLLKNIVMATISANDIQHGSLLHIISLMHAIW